MNHRIKLMLLAAVLVLPSILVYFAHEKLGWRPGGQKNYGELLPAARLAGNGAWGDGAGSGFERIRGKWALVYLGPSACDEGCRRSLYYMRQVRILQDSDRRRLQLVWVATDAGKPDPTLLQALPELWLWRPADAAFVQRFSQAGPAARHIFLVDPLGNLVLRFPARPDAGGMEKDIRQLLQASQIG